MKIVVKNVSDTTQEIKAQVQNGRGVVEVTSFSIMPKATATLEAIRFFGIDYGPDLARRSLVLLKREGEPPENPKGEVEVPAPTETQAPAKVEVSEDAASSESETPREPTGNKKSRWDK